MCCIVPLSRWWWWGAGNEIIVAVIFVRVHFHVKSNEKKWGREWVNVLYINVWNIYTSNMINIFFSLISLKTKKKISIFSDGGLFRFKSHPPLLKKWMPRERERMEMEPKKGININNKFIYISYKYTNKNVIWWHGWLFILHIGLSWER